MSLSDVTAHGRVQERPSRKRLETRLALLLSVVFSLLPHQNFKVSFYFDIAVCMGW